MGFGELQSSSRARASRVRRRRLVTIMIVAALAWFGVRLAEYYASRRVARIRLVPSSDNAKPIPPAPKLSISFGLGRQPVTRNITLETEAPSGAGTEAPDETISVRLRGDLQRVVVEETYPGATAEFPAEQITVGITRLSPARANLSVTANPWSPEKVPPGNYSGTLELRGEGDTQEVPIIVRLRTRESNWAVLAILLLIIGASLGLIVKWITESLTPQAAWIRRLTALKQAIGYREDYATLPVEARRQVRQLEDEIERGDYAAAEESFKKLAPHEATLAALSAQFEILLDQLSAQEQLIASAPKRLPEPELLKSVVDSEYRAVQALLASSDKEPLGGGHIASEATGHSRLFGDIHAIVAKYIEDPKSEVVHEALSHIQAGQLDDGIHVYKTMRTMASQHEGGSLQVGSHVEQLVPTLPQGLQPAYSGRTWSERPPMKFQFRWARVLAGIGSVLVVSLAGLKLEYLDDQQFDGSLSAWVGLLLWAAVVELSGISVLDVLGRLGGGGTRGRATAP